MPAAPVLVAVLAPAELGRPLPPTTSALVASFPDERVERARPGRRVALLVDRRVLVVGLLVLAAAVLLVPRGSRVLAGGAALLLALVALRARHLLLVRVAQWPRLAALRTDHVAVAARVTDVAAAHRQRRLGPGDHAWVEVTARDGSRWSAPARLSRRLLPEQGDAAVVWHHPTDTRTAVVVLADASQP